MKRQYEREEAKRAGGDWGRDAEHHVASAEAHRRDCREERGNPFPTLKALDPREAGKYLPQY